MLRGLRKKMGMVKKHCGFNLIIPSIRSENQDLDL